MKKKSPRGIPDFSSKRPLPGASMGPKPDVSEKTARPAAPPPRAKPQATSMKSGRRGA